MDPIIDEKFLVSISASIMEIVHENMSISIEREGYGSTLNEGLCYEFCLKHNFTGKEHGSIYFGMDGYSKLLILPYAVQKFDLRKVHPEVARDALFSFFYEIAKLIQIEIADIDNLFRLKKPIDISNRIQRLPTFKYRKYMMIFFLKDPNLKKYLGRLYCNLAFEKTGD